MRVISGFGTGLFFLAGIPMYIFEIYWFSQWWDAVGVAVGVFVPPVAAVFPFIYLFKEGFDSGAVLYFGIWAIGLLGLILAAVIDTD